MLYQIMEILLLENPGQSFGSPTSIIPSTTRTG